MVLGKKDKITFSDILNDYTRQTAGQYIYKVQKENLPKEIEKLAIIYHKIFSSIKIKYAEKNIFKIFERVYHEHFVALKDKVEVIPSNELNSSVLLSPDDDQATFRIKAGRGNKGYSGHISETANPENNINLITDVALAPNNIHDAQILEKRLPKMVSKTPDLCEYHADGGYGSPSMDMLMEKNNIVQIQNAVTGRKAFAKMEITEDTKGYFWVTCESGQKVKAKKADKLKNGKRHKAVFDYYKCLQCPLSDKCKSNISGIKTNKAKRTWYFSEEKIRLHKRKQNINLIPENRRKIRANVEATVKEVKRGIKNGKVRLRGKNRIMFYLSLTSIAVNLARIHKYLNDNELLYFDMCDIIINCNNNQRNIITNIKIIRSFNQKYHIQDKMAA